MSGDIQVKLDDVLRLVLPLSTTVTGGEIGDRQVNWATILAILPVPHDQVRSGDIVILPVELQATAGDNNLEQLIQLLSERSAAALLLFSSATAGVAKVAKRRRVPILLVPDGTSMREVHQSIAGLLVDRQKQINERGAQLYRRLTEMSREGKGLEAMTDVMSQLTRKAVVVQDKRLEFKAIAIPDGIAINEEELCATLCQPDTVPQPLRNRKAAANIRQSQWQQLLPMGESQIARLVSPIISGDRARGFVSVIGRPDELDLLDGLAAEHGAAACAVEMAKAKAVSEARKSLQGNLLEGMLAGTLSDQEIQRLAGRLDQDAGQRHAVMTFAWDGKNKPSLRRLETPIHWILDSVDQPTLTHIYGQDHVCVFQQLQEGDEEMNAASELALRVQEHLRLEFPDNRLLCGLGGPAETLADWPTAHQQAIQAMQLAQRLRMDTVVKFDSLGIYHLLAQLEPLPEMRQFCEQILGRLVSYDEQQGSSLVETITAFFDHHANVSQTAEALYIHRNTLLYRLERIQELTGQKLDQPDMRLALQLALKLYQLRPGESE